MSNKEGFPSAERSDFLKRVMRDSRAKLPVNDFVRAINVVHHEMTAGKYDFGHDYIWKEGKGVWRRLLKGLTPAVSLKNKLRILDFGCGTGFAAQQVINFFGPIRIDRIVLVEPSLEMREKAVQGLTEFGVTLECFEDLYRVHGSFFDIVCENSVIHHLPDPYDTLKSLSELVDCPGALILAQEPNKRYYNGFVGWFNRVSRLVLKKMRNKHTWEQASSNGRRRQNDELIRRGVIEVPIKDDDFGMIIDFGIPRPWRPERKHEELGFDYLKLKEVDARFSLQKIYTYQHLGKPKTQLGALLKVLDKILSITFPTSGKQLALSLEKELKFNPAKQ